MAKEKAQAEKQEKAQEKKQEQAAVSNPKAAKFQAFLEENNINIFQREEFQDDFKTVVYRSRIETKGQILPMAILIDNSVFTIIRTQLVSGIAADKRQKIDDYLKTLNMEYKIFKYYQRPDGTVFLDVCLPFVEETFDSKMIQLMLNILVQHLDAIYGDLMDLLWSKEAKTEDK